jgi:KDO2-lipid IV(A) lauroyltransferase
MKEKDVAENSEGRDDEVVQMLIELRSHIKTYVTIPRMSFVACIQYSLARLLLAFFGVLPRPIAYAAGRGVGRLAYRLAPRQRRVAFHNLEMAIPELPLDDRIQIVKGVFDNLGRLLVEFSHFPKINRSNIEDLVEYQGLEHYQDGLARGKGVLFLTAHIGAWELSSFAHSVYGYPMKFLTRPIDNKMVEKLIAGYRSRAGNDVINRNEAARGVLKALGNNEAVGILIDQNTTRGDGVFADFFGIPAATTPGLATFAMRTEATVVPGFIRWDRTRKKHVLEFQPPVELVRTNDKQADTVANTERFNQIIEDFVRRYPDQWLWIHRRWKTRPREEDSLYPRP